MPESYYKPCRELDISLAVAIGMIYFSFRITFVEESALDRETIENKEKIHIHFRRCG